MLQISEEMKVGIEKIDRQHQELVDRFNELSSMDSPNPLSDEVQKTLDLLGRYVVEHFNDEEELQRECAFPDYERHREQHLGFVQTFQKLREEFIADGTSGTFIMHLDNSLIGWVKDHIKGYDVEFGKFYREYKQQERRQT